MAVLLLILIPLVCSGHLINEENRELHKKCGREMPSAVKASAYKVFKGDRVQPNEYPFAVAVARRNPNRRYCTGVLISTHHVLTAAHCIEKYKEEVTDDDKNDDSGMRKHYYKPEEFVIYAGSRCPQPGPCSPNRTEYEALRIVVMPDYDTSTRDSTRFDLAIIELLRDVDENEAIPICMPPADLPLPKKLIAIGYGDDPHAENPREPGLQVTTFSKFKEREFEIDAIGQDRGTCGGDSGGPLFCKEKGRFTLIGIASAARYYCSEQVDERINFYCNVRKHVDWICLETGICPLRS